MACQVCTGGLLSCSFGISPAPINALPAPRVVSTTPAANIEDAAPMAVIPTFGMCIAPANPEVIAETAAALGVPTPAPCIPDVPSWIPIEPTVLFSSMPIVNESSMAMCAWGGMVTVSFAGQTTVMS